MFNKGRFKSLMFLGHTCLTFMDHGVSGVKSNGAFRAKELMTTQKLKRERESERDAGKGTVYCCYDVNVNRN